MTTAAIVALALALYVAIVGALTIGLLRAAKRGEHEQEAYQEERDAA